MHTTESRPAAAFRPTRTARGLIRRFFKALRDNSRTHDELARRQALAEFLAANPDHVTFVFYDGDCDPPYHTMCAHIIVTPTPQQFLAWEASDARDGCFADLRATRLADWQLTGQMRAIPMSDLALRFGR